MKPTVLITGILGGIGSEMAREFFYSGFKVIGIDTNEGECEFCDLLHILNIGQYAKDRDYRDIQNAWFIDNIPELKCLINNAAVQRLGSIDELDLNDWEETMAVNLTGPLVLSKFFIEKLERSNGSIINIASIHNNLTKSRFISYATSKSALVGLTKALSVDLQGRVMVNAISPAAVDTPMLREGFGNDEEKVKQLNEIHPIQRIGRPQEVARLCVFMAQNHFDFLNGTNIELDGGISNVLKDL